MPKSIDTLIRKRRSVFPPQFNGKSIPKKIIEQILENANWAPTHKRSEPWRFHIFESTEARTKLSDFLSDFYLKNTPQADFSSIKQKKSKENALKSAVAIAICMQPDETLPEWEEIAAVAAAVQNMLLTATAYNIGAFWSSPGAIKAVPAFLELPPNQRCLGFLYMGYSDAEIPGVPRRPIADKVTWRLGTG
jgi:nitroreductase